MQNMQDIDYSLAYECRSLSETRLQPLQHSLFLHIPNFSEIKEETQMKFLEDMIAKICAHIIEKSNESNIQSG